MRWTWFGDRVITFWQPITAPAERWWRDTHVWAHVLGGGVWVLVQQACAVALGDAHPLTWHPGLRVALVALWQAVGWEWTQHENWRPELAGLPPGTGYPWLSGVWDTIFAVVGATTILYTVILLTRFV